jgi:regulator-associated protein of mTOR
VRIWRDYDQPGKTALASTFRAVSETYPVGHSSGVLTAWQQNHGHLLVGGDMKVVRLWDATVERHLRVSRRHSARMGHTVVADSRTCRRKRAQTSLP